MTISGRRVLVAGGAGFIGSQVAFDLADAGNTVLVVDNMFAGARQLVPDGADIKTVDIRDEDLRGTVSSFDPEVVFHLAAIHYIPYCNANPEETFEVNVMGTRNLLSAARGAGSLKRVVFTSSAAVYPPRDGANHESSAVGPMDVYGQSKLVGEDLLELFHERTDVPCATARLFNTYGPRETNEHLIPAILRQVLEGKRKIDLGNLEPKRDFIHVTDVSRALVTLATEFDAGYEVFNVGTGSEYSVHEVVEKTSAALGENIEIVQDAKRVRESDRPHLKADISRLRSTFDWEPRVDLETGLARLLYGEEVLVE